MEYLVAFFASRVGFPAATLLLGLFIGWYTTSKNWQQYEAKQDAARQVLHQMELAREAQNAVEIAKAATQRAEDDAAELVSLQKQVSDFDKGEINAPDPCVMDDLFVGAARQLRQPTARPHRATVTRPPKQVR